MSRLYVVGIGPGGPQGMTGQARDALEASDVIVGYTTYVKLVEPLFPGKEVLSTPMMREIDRCRMAIERAASGDCVAMVCGGDAGVYGMASPILELAEGRDDIEIEVVPGVSAAQSGAAVLGAPLSHDFAVVSLSDLLTPWEAIERRLEAVGAADFCLALYNPRSSKRRDHLARAARILLAHRDPATPCGWVRNIGREGQESGLLTLGELADLDADMFTTVFVGNSATRVIDGKMVTPRGYHRKERA